MHGISLTNRLNVPMPQVMYLALDQVHPISLAVANTAKRVFIIVASLVRTLHYLCIQKGVCHSTTYVSSFCIYHATDCLPQSYFSCRCPRVCCGYRRGIHLLAHQSPLRPTGRRRRCEVEHSFATNLQHLVFLFAPSLTSLKGASAWRLITKHP